MPYHLATPAFCGRGVKKMKSTAPAMAQEVNAINERTAKAFTPLRFYYLISKWLFKANF